MPKGSPMLTEKRKNEILDACEKIYRSRGFCGVNIKEISTEISLTRPAIYNYFETKEEILLGLLIREYSAWCGELEALVGQAEGCSRTELAAQMAATLENKDILLRILNRNLMEIEQNSRVERLAEFKKQFQRALRAYHAILHAFQKTISELACTEFSESFSAFLLGIFPFTSHTEKQQEAMRLAGLHIREPSIYEMVYNCLLKLLPSKEEKGSC